VRRIAAEAEFTPRNVQTREDRDRLVYAVDVDVPNPDGSLRAGMPGEITIPGTER
jgi:HlyD family secretion protein